MKEKVKKGQTLNQLINTPRKGLYKLKDNQVTDNFNVLVINETNGKIYEADKNALNPSNSDGWQDVLTTNPDLSQDNTVDLGDNTFIMEADSGHEIQLIINDIDGTVHSNYIGKKTGKSFETAYDKNDDSEELRINNTDVDNTALTLYAEDSSGNIVKREVSSISGGGATIYDEVTLAEAITLVNNSTLITGVLYKITGVGALEDNVFVTALSTNEFDINGTREILCPTYYNIGPDGDSNMWKGVWHSSLTGLSTGDLVIYGAKVYQSVDGSIGTADSEVALNPTKWTLIGRDTFSNNEYIPKLISCQYDFINNWFCLMTDQFNNQVGIGTALISPGYNPCDVSDWNSTLTGGRPYIGNSNCRYGFFNNGNGTEFISNNKCIKITGNWNSGVITDNSCLWVENLPENVTEYRENNGFSSVYGIDAAINNLTDGNNFYFNCIQDDAARITEFTIYSSFASGTGVPLLSAGWEGISDLVSGVTLAGLNTVGNKFSGISAANTGNFNRFFVRSDGGDITSGEIFIKVSFTQY